VLFLKLLSISLRSQMQYRASFFMLSASHFLGTFVDILGIWVLFDRFNLVKGWTFPEIGLIYGIMNVGFALSEAFSRGFDTFAQIIKYGDFDRLLLRPLSPLFQVAVKEVHVMRIGRFLQGLIVLSWSFNHLSLTFSSLFLILFSIVGAACLFYGLFVIQATVSFWTIESLELMNILTYGGLQTGQYPISIYDRGFRLMFTFVIPIACVAYYPVALLLGRGAIPFWFGAFFPATGIVFLYLACQFWHFGVRHYRSTGS
jgi:ABC-2 type transport system permease protein